MRLEDLPLYVSEAGAYTIGAKATGELGDVRRRTGPMTDRKVKNRGDAVYLVAFDTRAEAEAYTLGIDHADGEEQWYAVHELPDDVDALAALDRGMVTVTKVPTFALVIVDWQDDCGEPGIHYHDHRKQADPCVDCGARIDEAHEDDCLQIGGGA